MIDIRVPVIPPKRTSQNSSRLGQSRSGKAIVFKTDGVESDWLSILLPHRIPKPLDGPLILIVRLVWPFTGKHLNTAAKRALLAHGAHLPCDQKPDADNVIKGLQDTMSKLRFWADDKQIFDLRVQKLYGHDPSVTIRVETWDGELL